MEQSEGEEGLESAWLDAAADSGGVPVGPSASIAELSECLLAVGPEHVLEWPLARLIATIEHSDTRELFEHMASDHRGYNLRAVLRFRDLDPWVARTCTAGEAVLMRDQLQAWLLQVRPTKLRKRTSRAWLEPIAEATLSLLSERLLHTLQHSAGADAPAPLFSRQRGPELDSMQALVHAELCSDERQASQGRFGVFRCELSLQGFEHSELKPRCSCEQQATNIYCCHVRALCEHLLDVLHGLDSPLRRSLADMCRTPSWVRFFSALGDTEGVAAPLEAAEQRLCYRLHVRTDASIGVELLLQKRKRDGGYSRGSRITADELPGALTSEPLDQLALGLLRSSAAGRGGVYSASVALLRVLTGHPCVIGADDPRAISLRETRVTLAFEPDGKRAGVLRAHARLGDASLAQVGDMPEGDHLAHWADDGAQLLFAPLPAALARWVWTLSHAHTLLPQDSHAQLRKRLRKLQPHVQLRLPPELLGEAESEAPKLLLRLENNLSEGIRLSLHSRPVAGGPLFVPGEGPSEVLGEDAGQARYALRDLAWERATVAELQRVLYLDLARELAPLRYNIETREAALAVLERVARAREKVDIEWLEGHRPLRLLPSPIKRTDLKLKVGHAEKWYEASGYAQLDAAQQVPLLELLDAARMGQRYVRVGQDSYASLHDELRALLESASHAMFTEKEKLKLSAVALPRLFELTELAQIERAPSIDALVERMKASHTIACKLPEPIASQLRPYQRDGAQFLLRLATWASGGCLADEMGLGKTIQSLTVLAARSELGPALVIAPTSVGHNWCNEAQRFTPELDVRLYRGERRSQLRDKLGQGSVLVTSYELATSDIAQLKGIPFATLVLDEAHMLKNAGTARARAIASLSAEFRVALTGTPLENHLGELWSLMAQLNPALLGSFTRFRAHFGLPIERYQDRERLAVLRQLVSPFILRRDKRSVAPELPARVEVTRVVPLSASERSLYDTAVSDLRRRIEQKDKYDLDRVTILSEITRLRQLACHPSLVVSDWNKPSSKLRALLSVLDDILPQGHRALLFSQFVSHLKLVQAALDARRLPYLYLDGATKASERAALAERWQAGETSLFLISLKAGGTGLNLSKADYVIQLDPWWNPAAEDQAADRAHRIGSDRPVTILRLLAQNTVEEQVAALHKDKRELAQSLLQQTGARRLALDELTEFLGLHPRK
jgi:superfamily II DNA or RNA helicase